MMLRKINKCTAQTFGQTRHNKPTAMNWLSRLVLVVNAAYIGRKSTPSPSSHPERACNTVVALIPSRCTYPILASNIRPSFSSRSGGLCEDLWHPLPGSLIIIIIILVSWEFGANLRATTVGCGSTTSRVCQRITCHAKTASNLGRFLA